MIFFIHPSGVSKDYCLKKPITIIKLTLAISLAFNTQLSAKSYSKTITPSILAPTLPFNDHIVDLKISGKVVDELGQPLVGVSVKIKGSTGGTTTDVNGSFTITAPDNATLIFSYLGYTTQENPVNGQTSLSVRLISSGQSLSEIVVVGYGTQKKSDVTGAVVRANLEDFREAPNTNIIQSLQGTAPGLNIGQVSSAGATPSIQVRGATTINGNANVLIVLDGIIYSGSLASINPDDVASIDVLKDASSTAIYGAQAANGVLIITTRKGKAGKTRVSYTGSYATQAPSVGLRPLDKQQYLDKIRDLNYEKAFLAPGYTTPNPNYKVAQDLAAVLPNAVDAAGNITSTDFDWWDAATKTGNIQEHQLGISGGTDKTNYLLSGGLTNQKGFIINDIFKRKSVRLNFETKATDWWKIGVQSFAAFSDYSGAEPTLNAIIRHAPVVSPYDSNGNLIPTPTNTILDNPFLTYDIDDYDRRNNFFANFYSEITIPYIKGLSYRLNYGHNYRTEKRYQASKYGAGLTGSASKDNRDYYDYTIDNIVNYNRNFNKIHDVSVTLLYSAIKRTYSRTLASATDFSSLTLGYNSLEQGTNQTATSDAWSETLNSQMGRLNYKLMDKYLLTGTIRRDGFSGFAKSEKYGIFPSAALGWIISEESFLKKITWIDILKLRLSYGVNGNLTSRYSSLATFSRGRRYIFGDGGSPVFGQQVESLANDQLRWERTSGLNLGLDFNLLKGRLNGSLDVYNNITNNLLFDVSLPGIIGISQITTNVGKLNNRGIELALTSENIRGKDFKWTTTFNFSKNTNKIKALVGLDANKDGKEDDLVQDNLFIGRSIGSVRTYQSNGIYQLTDQIPTGYYPGTFRVVDLNGDGIINAADISIIGRTEPNYRLSMLNSFTYKNFTFRAFLNSVQGGSNSYLGSVIEPNIGSVLSDNSMRLNYFQGIDYWSPSNPNAKFPRSKIGPAIAPGIYQTRSFVRLQDVSLSYRFTGGFVKRLKLENVNVYVSGKNLYTWTNWPGWDPETGQGFNDSGRPVMKGFSFGLNVSL